MAPEQPPEPPIPALVAPAPARPRPSRFRAWALLNPYSARHASSVALGVVGFRTSPERHERLGYSVAFGEALTTLRGGFAAGGLQEHELRYVPSDSLSLALSRYQWEAGPRLGALEPMARVGFTLLHLDVGHGVSFGMFSPRVGVGVWLSLPGARLGASVFSEYAWRWVGDHSAFVHGLTLELQPTAPPLLGGRATSWPSSPSRP